MLVVFDIDGTLTRTYSLDEQLFARTFLAVRSNTFSLTFVTLIDF
jgi:hydroxymethylpyrimidine pyrophosphatase-like HAD family hydrolase